MMKLMLLSAFLLMATPNCAMECIKKAKQPTIDELKDAIRKFDEGKVRKIATYDFMRNLPDDKHLNARLQASVLISLARSVPVPKPKRFSCCTTPIYDYEGRRMRIIDTLKNGRAGYNIQQCMIHD